MRRRGLRRTGRGTAPEGASGSFLRIHFPRPQAGEFRMSAVDQRPQRPGHAGMVIGPMGGIECDAVPFIEINLKHPAPRQDAEEMFLFGLGSDAQTAAQRTARQLSSRRAGDTLQSVLTSGAKTLTQYSSSKCTNSPNSLR